MAMDYIDDGSINNGWETYFKNACTTGAPAGFSMGAMDKFKALEKSGKYSCEQLGRMRLAADMALDTMVSLATTGDADLGQIFLRNYLANKLTLSDPVDGATGSLYIPATDMRVPDMEGDYCITRKYESINRRTGMLGHGWTCSLESRLVDRSGECLVLCTDGHVESFHRREGIWQNDKGGSQRMQLSWHEDKWCLYDVAERKQYLYDAGGKLTEIIDRHGKRSLLRYEKEVLCEVTTFAGSRISVTMEGGRLTALTDELGRCVTYTYDGENLVCVNQYGRGLTRYTYDKKGYIVDITDQNNKKYTKNTFDLQGRVTRQDYPDGSCCEISYNSKDRTVTFYYPETGGSQTTSYDAEYLVTAIRYQDGTTEEYAYDCWQNRIYEKDRNGNTINREFTIKGEKKKETLGNGLVYHYEYDGDSNLLRVTDTAGGCTEYTYDSRNYLTEKASLVSEAPRVWCREKYGYDEQGRRVWQEDGNGNRHCYVYGDNKAFCPELEITPEGYEFFYTYDKAGRRTGTEVAGNRMSFSYNGLHYVNHTVDGEGNETHFEYDNLGSLTRVFNHRQWEKSRNGGGYTYEYDFFDRLIRVKDPLGRVKRLVRNGQGSILYESPLAKPGRIPEADRSGGIRGSHDANDYRVEALRPDGSIYKTRYDAMGNLVYECENGEGSGRYYIYGANNRSIRVELEDGTIEHTFTYDLKGNLLEETDALGQKTCHAYDLSGRHCGIWEYVGEEGYRVIHYIYDNAGNVVEERRGTEVVSAYEYPHRYLAIKKKYDKQNRLVCVEDGTGARVTYRYDYRNNCVQETRIISEGVENRINYVYDRTGRLIRKEENTSCSTYTYDKAGNLASVTLPEGGVLRLVYDEADRPVSVCEEDKQSGIRRSRVYRYGDTCALAWEQLQGRREEFTGLLNRKLMGCVSVADYSSKELLGLFSKEQPTEVRYYSGKKAAALHKEYERVYEAAKLWNPEEITSVDAGEEGRDYFTRRYQYDFRGNLLSYEDTLGNRTKAVYNPAGKLTNVHYADGAENTFTYDSRGNLLSKTNGAGEREYLLGYDALNRVISETDGEGNTTSYRYDGSGKVTEITGPDGATDRLVLHDIWGRPERVTDGNGNTTTYTKDQWGRVTEVTYADGSVEKYSYDYAGNVTKATDGLGNETDFRYNEANRLESIRKADRTVRSFGYDREGRCNYRRDEKGTIQRMTYSMDGNPLSMTGAFKGEEEPVIRSSYTYDERGYLTCAAEGGSLYRYERDREGRTVRKQILGNATGALQEKGVLDIAYDSRGRLSSVGDTHYSYDRAGRLSVVENTAGICASYQYNKNGMQTQVCCGNGLNTAYTYDSRNRLTGMTSGFAGKAPLLKARYSYDGNGNRVGKDEVFLTGLGNISANTKTIYSYDSRNRLTAEAKDDRETSYTYDHAGNRTSRTASGITETYLYSSRNQLTELVGADRNIRYSYGGRQSGGGEALWCGHNRG